MTFEKAIFILKDHFDKRNWCNKSDADEALEMAIKALEKGIPKQTAHGHWIFDYFEEIIQEHIYHCSICGSESFYETPYCSNCGAEMESEVSTNEP